MGTYGQLGSLIVLGLAAGGFYYGVSDSDQPNRPDRLRETNVSDEHPDAPPEEGRCDQREWERTYFTADGDGRRPPPPREERFRRGGPPPAHDRGEGPPPGPPPRPPKPPIERVLDADQDGIISSEEMAQAGERLKKLDMNEDGKLTHDEFAPPPPPHGSPGFGPPGDRPPPRGGARQERPSRPVGGEEGFGPPARQELSSSGEQTAATW